MAETPTKTREFSAFFTGETAEGGIIRSRRRGVTLIELISVVFAKSVFLEPSARRYENRLRAPREPTGAPVESHHSGTKWLCSLTI